MPGPLDRTTTQVRSPVWIISGVCGILLAAHLLLKWKYEALKDGLDAITLGLTAVGLSPWIARVIESFKFGGLELKFVKQLEEQRQEINVLKLLFIHLLTYWERHHLRALVNNQEFIVRKGHYPQDLYKELRRLRELGFIASPPDKSLRAMDNDPREEKSLHEYFFATDLGKQYISMRDAWAKELFPDQIM
jgi:hypothetical protein